MLEYNCSKYWGLKGLGWYTVHVYNTSLTYRTLYFRWYISSYILVKTIFVTNKKVVIPSYYMSKCWNHECHVDHLSLLDTKLFIWWGAGIHSLYWIPIIIINKTYPHLFFFKWLKEFPLIWDQLKEFYSNSTNNKLGIKTHTIKRLGHNKLMDELQDWE